MKTTVEKKKKEFQKTIDKSQKLMYNKYVRLREEKPSRMKNPKTFETLNACRWGSSCDLATARYDRSERAAKYSQTFRTGQRSQTNAGVVEWHTQQTQNLPLNAYGFKSHHRHQILLCI